MGSSWGSVRCQGNIKNSLLFGEDILKIQENKGKLGCSRMDIDVILCVMEQITDAVR